MSTGYPCPNPTCHHQFSAPSIQGAPAVTCPKCGTVLQFRARSVAQPQPTAQPAPPQPTPAPPVPKRVAKPRKAAAANRPPAAKPVPVPAPRAAAPVPAAIPTAAPVQPRSDSMWRFGTKPNETVDAPPRRLVGGRLSWLARIPLILVVMGMIGALGYFGYWMLFVYQPSATEPAPNDKAQNLISPDFEPFNYVFQRPPQPWTINYELRERLGMPLTMSRSEPSNAFSLDYQKFSYAVPGKPILLDRVLAKIRNHFFDVAWEPQQPATLQGLEKLGKLGGQPALVIDFYGDRDDITYAGEVHVMDHRGVAYWLVTWAPNNPETLPQAKAEWKTIREQFKLQNGREGWTPRGRPTKKTKGDRSLYVIDYRTEEWEQMKASDYGVGTDKVLVGHDPQDRKKKKLYAGKKGEAHFLIGEKQESLEKAGAFALENLRQYVKSEGVDGAEITVIEDRAGNPLTGPATLVERADNSTTFVRWKRKVDEKTKEVSWEKPKMSGREIVDVHLANYQANVGKGSFNSFYLLCTIPRPEQTLTIRCECIWKRRDYWETEFYELLRSYQPLKP